MQITVNIPDEFAAQVEALGLSPEAYLERLIARATKQRSASEAGRRSGMEEFEAALDALARHSDKIPALSVETFSRENLYSDHD